MDLFIGEDFWIKETMDDGWMDGLF